MENRQDCFAKTETGCSALQNQECKTCHFYRNDISKAKIEKDINKYSFGTSKRKESYD